MREDRPHSPPQLSDRSEPSIDLEPYNWSSDREKPREPIFGPGWPIAVGIVLSIIVATIFADGTAAMKVIGGILGAVIMGIVTSIYL